jgi:hypothetical protein
MKKLLITTASLAVMAISAYSQGNVNFANVIISGTNPRPVNAPVTAEDGTTRLTGTAYQAQLWARPAGSSTAYAQIGAGQTFLTAPGFEGYWTPATRSIPGVAGGEQAQLVARVWRVSGGATWDTARQANRGWGESNPITITLTSPPATPALMIGLQGFSLVPEPSTIALGILGGLGTLFLVRRRKN